jgi:hypothetical protein
MSVNKVPPKVPANTPKSTPSSTPPPTRPSTPVGGGGGLADHTFVHLQVGGEMSDVDVTIAVAKGYMRAIGEQAKNKKG